ncbi:MAG TPA: EAL domain-containing protein, partial [Oscillospiraceae bacterium]|nr:EAL domain-containing protein [Oscillospiraceae bacterium]
SMVKICAEMGAMCIAEGVDSEEKVRGLLEAGCEYAQGYYYNKPLPAEEFAAKYLIGAAG